MSAHSRIGASSMYRWSACPGSVKACADLESKTSAYAEEGTEAHDHAAKWLADHAYVVPGEFAQLASYLEYVVSVPGKLLVEHKFDLSAVYPGCFGTADAVVFDAKTRTLHVIDLKYGQGIPVEVIDKNGKINPQLQYYALGALVTTKFNPEKVCMTIVQPRCEHPDGPIRSHTIDVVDLLEFRADLVEYAKATEAPNAPRVSGGHCRFCAAAAICPELKAKAQVAAKMDFSPDLPYDAEQLRLALDSRPALQAWLKRLDEFAYAEAEAGRCPPGYKLVAKQARRAWRDEGEVIQALQDTVPAEVLFEPRSIKSPAQLEKALGKGSVDAFVTKESSGHVLVPEYDKRPAVKVSAAIEFTQD